MKGHAHRLTRGDVADHGHIVRQVTLRRPMVLLLACGHLLRFVYRGQGRMYVERCECTQIEEE